MDVIAIRIEGKTVQLDHGTALIGGGDGGRRRYGNLGARGVEDAAEGSNAAPAVLTVGGPDAADAVVGFN